MKYNVIKIIMLFSSLLLLTGCFGSSPRPVYITKYKTIIEKPPKALYQDDINIPQPPNPTIYVKSNPVQREQLLTQYVIKLLYTIKKYKIKLNSINNWYKEMDININKVVNTKKEK